MATARKPGWWYPWIFVGAMGVVIVVNGVLIFTATRTFSGVSTDRAYEKGLAYNTALAEARAQENRGWKVEMNLEPAGAGQATIRARYRDKEGVAVDGLSVRALLERPAVAGHDFQAKLVAEGEGRYVALVGLPFPGQWQVTLVAEGRGVPYQTSERLVSP